MTKVKVAHVVEQGQQMIIIPLDDSFGHKSDSEQSEIYAALQACATGAGLAGRVAIVWNGGFRAPKPWHPFFRTFPVLNALASVNKELSCG